MVPVTLPSAEATGAVETTLGTMHILGHTIVSYFLINNPKGLQGDKSLLVERVKGFEAHQ
jgi:hypothetical protein